MSHIMVVKLIFMSFTRHICLNAYSFKKKIQSLLHEFGFDILAMTIYLRQPFP